MPWGRSARAASQSVVGGLEGAQRGESCGARQQNAGVDGRRGEGELRVGLLGRDLTQEPGPPGSARQGGAGQSPYPERRQLGQVQSHGPGGFERLRVRQHERYIAEGQVCAAFGTGNVGGAR